MVIAVNKDQIRLRRRLRRPPEDARDISDRDVESTLRRRQVDAQETSKLTLKTTPKAAVRAFRGESQETSGP
jgi:hypothetical protein